MKEQNVHEINNPYKKDRVM